MPTFSVIIPAYNAERYVEQCVRSVLAQTYRDVEVIVVDDGSTDRTPAVLDALAREDDRVRVVRVANGGVARARNLGVDHATGQYVTFIDADDYWDDTHALAGLAAIVETRAPDVINWGFKKLFPRSGRVDASPSLGTDLPAGKGELLDTLLRAGQFVPSAWSKAIRRELFTAHDLTFEPDVQSEDLEWVARVARFADTIVHYDNPFYVYRQIKGSRSKTFREDYVHDTISHFMACREHALAADNEPLKQALLTYAAERYVEALIVAGHSTSTRRHLRRLRGHADILANDVGPRGRIIGPLLRTVARHRRLEGPGLAATVQAFRLKRAIKESRWL